MQVELRNEIIFKAPTRVGLLADVTAALAEKNVNLLAIGAYDKGDLGEFLMITSNNRAAFEALGEIGGEMDLVPVVVVTVANEPGALASVARKIADAGLNISQIHATTTDAGSAMVVLRSDDEAHVAELLAEE